MNFFKIEELHDLRIIFKSGASMTTKNVRDWKFSETSYNIKWPNAKFQNIASLRPDEIAAVEITKRRLRIVWS